MKSRKQTFAFVIFALFMFAFSSPSILAQQKEEESTATLDETITFLKDFIGSNGDVPLNDNEKKYYASIKSHFESLGGCSIRISSDYILLDKNIMTDSFTFSLRDIEPIIDLHQVHAIPQSKEINFYRSLIALRTTNEKETVTFQQVIHGITKGDNSFGMSIVKFDIFETADGDNQKRIIRALKHAIKLCGGQVAPF